MDKKEVIKKVKQYKLLIRNQFDLDSVYLFGSYSNGTNRDDSDIDVAVVVKNIKGDYFDTTPLLWKIRREVDERIEPVLIDKDNDKSGFLEDIIKHGIKIS